MPWVKLDSSRATHRKLRSAGFAARGLDEAAMCQVCEDGTDGFLSDSALSMLAAAHGEKRVSRLVDILCSPEVNRWEHTAGGYLVHDYLVYNPSKAEWDALVAKKSAAGSKGGKAKALAHAVADAKAHGLANDVAKPLAVSFRSVSTSVDESTSGPKKKGANRTGMPKDFAVSDEMRAQALKAVPGLDVDHETSKFQLHAEANGSKYVNWKSAWLNWMLNAPRMGGKIDAIPVTKTTVSMSSKRAEKIQKLETFLAGSKRTIDPDLEEIADLERQIAQLKAPRRDGCLECDDGEIMLANGTKIMCSCQTTEASA